MSESRGLKVAPRELLTLDLLSYSRVLVLDRHTDTQNLRLKLKKNPISKIRQLYFCEF